ncbi:MAG: hypothetical protein AUK32_03810 [Candidatus Aquicultor secundus]|nr:MAG: hypothetical protein AUK32_03810 [Candidatus Aquicultor secundus]PIY38321.1 MAG: hypothetical protein COZ03_08470 [Candidatus Aquicultor secundus]
MVLVQTLPAPNTRSNGFSAEIACIDIFKHAQVVVADYADMFSKHNHIYAFYADKQALHIDDHFGKFQCLTRRLGVEAPWRKSCLALNGTFYLGPVVLPSGLRVA